MPAADMNIGVGEMVGVWRSEKIEFGTDGWRGIIADDFTFTNVCRVTRAIALYLEATYDKTRPVLVGYDTRFLADCFARTAAEILAEAGWSVKLAERDCPTPAIAYSARALQSAGAMMFTASHNPASYCGIKYIPDYGGPATPDITDAIAANLDQVSAGPPRSVDAGQLVPFDPQPAYLAAIQQLLDPDRIRAARLNVIYDALYSTSRGYLDNILRDCGCQTETLHAYRDVLFGQGMPDPKGTQLGELVETVRQRGADVGVATDGDSDRFGVVDEEGNIVSPNTLLLLLARHLIKNKGKTGAIVRTVATTHLLDTFALKYGLEIYETPVGFKYIGQKMRETDVLIGGEESGGLSVTGHIPEKDGILANLLVIEAIAYEGKPLSQMVRDVIAEAEGPRYNHRIDLRLSNAHKTALLQSLMTQPPTAVATVPVQRVGYQDGVKLYLADGSWVLLRPSGTEPLMRVYMETRTQMQQTQIVAYMQQLIQGMQPTVA